jgi:hypothetical protein
MDWQSLAAVVCAFAAVMGTLIAIAVPLLGRLGTIRVTLGKVETHLAGLDERWHECRADDRDEHKAIAARLDDHEERIVHLENAAPE